MLMVENCLLVVIDIQGTLAQKMHDKPFFIENLKKMIKGAHILDVPMLVTEQIPQKLGPTLPEIVSLFSDFQPIPKASFSCCGEPEFMKKFNAIGHTQILLTGIEAHVCVYQTALELKNIGYEVHLIADCVSSRTAENKLISIERMKTEGIKLTSTEMVLFELMKIAEGDKFREMVKIVK
jgi:nicotinamidase-related amidase